MKYLKSTTLLFVLSATSVHAEGVGIDFQTMKPGTKLTTITRGYYEATYIEEYLGKRGDFFQTQTYKLLDDGSLKTLNLSSYDEKGRKVQSTLDGKTNTYTPYSCLYVVGRCTHTYQYYNALTGKYVTNENTYENRLDGYMFYVGLINSADEMTEVPFELGPHRLRVASEHNNKLGTRTGHDFVDLFIPQ